MSSSPSFHPQWQASNRVSIYFLQSAQTPNFIPSNVETTFPLECINTMQTLEKLKTSREKQFVFILIENNSDSFYYD